MGTYDPAWDMPQVNWQQQGSFESGAIPPAVAPDAGTQICIPVAQEWLQVILGALDQLRNPSTWIVADDDALYQTLARVDRLREIIATSSCEASDMMRFTPACGLEQSFDGGITWVPVPGWVDNFANCVRDSIPPPAPPGPPVGGPQRACNIAGYLAQKFIVQAINEAVSSRTTEATILQWVVNFGIAIFGVALPITALGLEAINLLFQLVTDATVAEFNTAAGDPTLAFDVMCAIYNAILADGEITDGNFPTVLANICAIPYSSPDVIAAICAFVGQLGAVNMRAVQAVGVYGSFDCSACSTWCVRWGPLETDRPMGEWAALNPGYGVLSGGEWVSEVIGPDTILEIGVALPASAHILGVEVRGEVYGGADPGDRHVVFLPVGSDVPLPTTGPGPFDVTDVTAVDCTTVAVGINTRSDTGPQLNKIQNVLIRGSGPNPFGADSSNCV